jgi:hypothetical protein
MSSQVRISKWIDPDRGGYPVEAKILDRTSTTLYPEGIRRVVHTQEWRDIGVLMPEVKNHVEEQPTNRWKRALIERERTRAEAQRANA